MKHAEDARAEELDRLKLALATFALQLDAFELRTQDVLIAIKPAIPVPLPDSGPGLARIGTRKDRASEG